MRNKGAIFNTDYQVITALNKGIVSEASITNALPKKSYRATPQRIAISRFAISNRDHPTAREIYGEVREAPPTVSRTLLPIYIFMSASRQMRKMKDEA